MGIVAETALGQHLRRVRVYFRKTVGFVAVDARCTAFESEPASPGHLMTLRAFHVLLRWMLTKRREARGRIGTAEEAYGFLAVLPDENQFVLAGCNLRHEMEHVGERLRRIQRLTVELETAFRRGGNNVDLSGWER